jgi:hypothetical protein
VQVVRNEVKIATTATGDAGLICVGKEDRGRVVEFVTQRLLSIELHVLSMNDVRRIEERAVDQKRLAAVTTLERILPARDSICIR